jgi:dihydroflavonol-4-reductase
MTGKAAPKIRLPHHLILAIAYLAEGWARCFKTGEPFVNVDSVRMAQKRMFFSSQRARQELGYAPRPVNEAFRDAIRWYKDNAYLNGGHGYK